jgi:hypothetical protein
MTNYPVNTFTQANKDYLLEDQDSVIDKGIRTLTDAINSFDEFATMNSCQGSLIPEEAEKHCPLTYVDFYVLNDEYEAAEWLLIKLTSRFGQGIQCKLSFEADFDFIDENTVEDNGHVNYRYRIQIEDLNIYDDVVEFINNIMKG